MTTRRHQRDTREWKAPEPEGDYQLGMTPNGKGVMFNWIALGALISLVAAGTWAWADMTNKVANIQAEAVWHSKTLHSLVDTQSDLVAKVNLIMWHDGLNPADAQQKRSLATTISP